MMQSREYIITSDTTCDLPQSYCQENGITLLSVDFTLDGVTYSGTDSRITPEEFYARMRAGAMPMTQQVTPQKAETVFEDFIKKGYDILHIGFSSALSGSYNSAVIAANELKERYPEATIVTIDSLCASLGEGLLVHKAVEMKMKGVSLSDNAKWLEDNKLKLCHYFTVDDLNHLHRGGRVSKAAAVFGTALNIKPVLHVSNEGKLVPVEKVRGRKQSLIRLVDHMEERAKGVHNDEIFISHGDCLEDAKFVAQLIKERFGIDKVLYNFVGQSVGAHSGPGTVALFFFGTGR